MAATFTGIRVSGVIRLTEVPTPAPADLYPQYTVLRLPGTGTNNTANNTFVDSSSNNFAITRFGNTTQGSFSPFSTAAGYWSNYFDGNGDFLTTGTAVSIGTQAFTIEAWIYIPSSISGAVFSINTAGSLIFGINSTQVFLARSGVANDLIVTYSIPTNQWNHVICVRSGTGSNQTAIYVNGLRVAQGTVTTSYSSGGLVVGARNNSLDPFQGYISNVRFVLGSAIYNPTEASITVPTTPLVAVPGTSLLTCQSNRFIDNSSNNFTITRSGDTAVSAFGPFAPSSSYNSATMGGSIYFDGTGDYLRTLDSSNLTFGTGDLTIECWIYQTASSTGAYQTIIADNIYGSLGGYALYSYNNALNLWIGSAGGGTELIAPAGTITLNSWNQVVWTRSGLSNRLFINGVQVGLTTSNGQNFTSSQCFVAASRLGTFLFQGYISNLRIVKGTAVYTANFTPPTAPVAAITGTQLLLNGTNGAIVDQSTKNILETVSGAKISTTISANGSMSFNGSTDYLTMPASVNLAFGTGDFTAEFWIYKSASGTAAILDYASAGGFGINITNTQIVPFISVTTAFGANAVVPLNTWTHVAVSRQGTTLRTFMNGSLVGTSTTSANFISPSVLNIGRNPGAVPPTFFLNGYLQDLRLTKGIARYTTNFTPPTRS